MAAARHERELHGRVRELDEVDRSQGLGAWPAQRPTHRRTRGPTGPALLVSVLVLGGVLLLGSADPVAGLRRVVGLGGDRPLPAPAIPAGTGSYAFVSTQRGSDDPVGYDPCRTIEVVINPEGAPADHEAYVRLGLDRVSAATGLDFDLVGTSEERPDDRFGRNLAGRKPVLVAWATAEEVPRLSGDVAGIAGSTTDLVGGSRHYGTGAVVLDADTFGDGRFSRADLQSVVDHELGHLVGLAHVDDPGELMHGETRGASRFGDGDLEGLARLGNVPCG